MKKNRLDHFLVQQGFFDSRASAQNAIKDGHIIVDVTRAVKASSSIAEGCEIVIAPEYHGFVSRGGIKLAHAIEHFNVNISGKICIDVGASTGGFCDVLLKNDAAKIYAIDVGHGQLHPSIANNQKVINVEKTNSKTLNGDLIAERPQIIVCDVSFISLKKALPKALELLEPKGVVITLIKPQFELGPDKIGKGGLVNASEEEIENLKDNIYNWFLQCGFKARNDDQVSIINSPIQGGDGNHEFLLCMDKCARKISVPYE